MSSICTLIVFSIKKNNIMVHLFSVSVREFTEIFQDPKQTNSCLALLTHLNESKTNSNMQIRVMPLVGIARSLLCSAGACAAANILIIAPKEIRHPSLGYMYAISLRSTYLIAVPKNIMISVFIPNMFSCMCDLYWLLTAFT